MLITLKPINELVQYTSTSLTGQEYTLITVNNATYIIPISYIYTYATSQLNNVENLSVITQQDIQTRSFAHKYITYDMLSSAFTSLGIFLTKQQQTNLLNHLQNYNNPHSVTKTQIQLGNVENLSVVSVDDIQNVSGTTGTSARKYVTFDMLYAANQALGYIPLDRLKDYPPVTLVDIQNKAFNNTYITYALLGEAILSLGLLISPSTKALFLNHLTNYSNPHSVSAAQVGLGYVANYLPATSADLPVNPWPTKYLTLNLLSEALGYLSDALPVINVYGNSANSTIYSGYSTIFSAGITLPNPL